MMPLKAHRVVSWLLVVLCMTAILGFSSQEGEQSESLSFRVTAFVLRLVRGVEPDMSSDEFLHINYIIRKIAHVCEYTLLGLLLCWALFVTASSLALRGALLYAIGFTFAFADEWRQTAVSGRVGRFEDVLVDMIGVALAALCSLIWARLRKKRAS